MSNWVISLILAVGGGTWIFNKLQQTSGYANTTQSVIAASVSAGLIFGLFMLALNLIG